MREEVIKELKSIVGEDWVVSARDAVEAYLYDETAIPIRPQASGDVVVVKPGSVEEVSKILSLANEHKVPVFPRGGGTGLVGACIPTVSGIVLSLERMNKITIDTENLMAEAEAGATLRDLIEAADNAGLSFPLHPGDEGAQIGGLIACNAGGARAVKTGIMRNYVKGIEAVLPTGEIITLGGKVLKNNVGYDLMHLLIGSEGTLGVITKAWIRLQPREVATATIVIPFESREKALGMVPKIFQEGILPLAIEYVERNLVERVGKELGLTWPCTSGEYQLMIILSESSEEALLEMSEKLLNLCEKVGALEPVVAETRKEQDEILKIRSEIYSTLKPDMVDILDTTVPPAKMIDLIRLVNELEAKYGVYMPVYGHAGDGNLHVHLMKWDGWTEDKYDELRNMIYEETLKLGGTITGEHGIGYLRKKYLEKVMDEKAIELMKAIKKIFDPNGILNPDKVLP
ncbi:MAG TPA: FAD-binding oxidoreductase [Nitrososphaeria archaeon]|nr:FAD-binding oxidoreductase [Nitrososphaeria archaeon]